MPRIIRTQFDPIPQDDVLIPSAWLRNDLAANSLVTESRRRARHLVEQARQEADEIRRSAAGDGYVAGFVEVVGLMAGYLHDHEQLAQRLWCRLEDEMRRLLRQCIDDPGVVIAALEQALAQRRPGGELAVTAASSEAVASTTGVELILPESWRVHHALMVSALSAHLNATPRISHWDQERIVLRSGDHVIEFVPADFVAQACLRQQHLLHTLGVDSANITAQCRARARTAFASATSPADAWQTPGSELAS